jgi:hypothetical protein
MAVRPLESLLMKRRSPTLQLKLGRETFPVKKTQLLEKLGLFQDLPSLLAADSYEVQTNVSSEVFQEFLRVIKGGPITVSDGICASFWHLGQEFRFELLSAACTAFKASKEGDYGSLSSTELSSGAFGFGETPMVSRPCVTITGPGYRHTYEALGSLPTAMAFVNDLYQVTKNGITIEGIDGGDGLIEKAVRTVYSNTVAVFGDSDAGKSHLVLILWTLQDQLSECSINSTLYCLDQLDRIAPTAFDKARLLILSQWDKGCSVESGIVPGNLWVVSQAVTMLKEEKNGQRERAMKLLNELRETGRFSFVMGMLRGTEQVSSPARPGDGTRAGPGVNDDYRGAASHVKGVMDANSGVFHEKNAQRDFAARLLEQLKTSGRRERYSFASGIHCGRKQVSSPAAPGEVASAQGDGTRAGPGVEDDYQGVAPPVIGVVDENSAVFHDPTKPFDFGGRLSFPGMRPSRPGRGLEPEPGQYATIPSDFEQRRDWCRHGMPVVIGSSVPSPITGTTGCPGDFSCTSRAVSGPRLFADWQKN